MIRDQRDRDALCARYGHDWGSWYHYPMREPLPSVSWRRFEPSAAYEPARYTAKRHCQCCGAEQVDRSNEK